MCGKIINGIQFRVYSDKALWYNVSHKNWVLDISCIVNANGNAKGSFLLNVRVNAVTTLQYC